LAENTDDLTLGLDTSGFVLTDGSNPMTGDLDMDGNDIIDVGTINTITIEDHHARHERGGGDEMDGDHLDIDFTPSNYTPSTVPAEAANVDDLAAHLAGIDDALGAVGGGGVPADPLTDIADIAAVPQWFKFTIDYTDVTALGAVASGSVTYVTIPIKAWIHALWWKAVGWNADSITTKGRSLY